LEFIYFLILIKAIAALGMSDSSMLIWDWSTNTVTCMVTAAFNGRIGLKLILNGTRVACASYVGSKFYVYTLTGTLMENSHASTAFEEQAGSILASAETTGGKCRFWNVTTSPFTELTSNINISPVLNVLKQTKIANKLAAGGDDNKIYIMDTSSYTVSAPMTGHTAGVYFLDVTFSGLLISGSLDNSIRLWNISTSTCLNTLSNPLGMSVRISALEVITSNSFLVAGNSSKFLIVGISTANVMAISQTINLPVSTSTVNDLKVTTEGVVLLALNNGNLTFYDLNTGQFTQTLTPSSTPIVYAFDIISKFKIIYPADKRDLEIKLIFFYIFL
jgi:WD40 repeat protein